MVIFTQVVLGIDAAWTSTEPSGVALVGKGEDGWTLIGVAASYQRFTALGDPDLAPEPRPTGALPSPASLLGTTSRLAGRPADLVAIDMPLSRARITSRRAADNEVSRAFGARKAGTHTPSELRPGPISDVLTERFNAAGYPLQTTSISAPTLIEVYPHPALIVLTGAEERLPYKGSKTRQYWPNLTVVARRVHLYAAWQAIVASLEREVRGVTAALPGLSPEASGRDVKAYEDMLDAVICAWVGICALEGRARPYGDDQSAIWIPVPS